MKHHGHDEALSGQDGSQGGGEGHPIRGRTLLDVIPQALQSLVQHAQRTVELSRILAQLPSDRLRAEPLLVEIPGLPDAVEGVLGDGDPASLPQVRDGIFPQVAVQGRTRDAEQTTDLVDRVDSPSSLITRIFCDFFSPASMLTQSSISLVAR